MTTRDCVIAILQTKFPKEVAVRYENAIYESWENYGTDDYNNMAYEKVGELMETDDRDIRKKIAADIKNNRYGWASCIYNSDRDKINIENDRIINPPEIKEGGIQCSNCKSTKTYHYQLQTRGGDEPMTNFVTCKGCGKKWKF